LLGRRRDEQWYAGQDLPARGAGGRRHRPGDRSRRGRRPRGLDGWLLGPHDSAAYPEPHRSGLNPSGTLRKHFDLYANIRPAKGFPGTKAIAPDADLAGEIPGSLGLASSLNASDRTAMAQAAHGSTPDIAGRNVANPVSMILSTALLLRWLADRHTDAAATTTAHLIERAVTDTIAAGARTRDVGGVDTTSSFHAAVLDRVGGQ
jgi:isocitrate/isopropylmalate dehydrogenase